MNVHSCHHSCLSTVYLLSCHSLSSHQMPPIFPHSPVTGLAHPLRSPVTRQLSEYLSQPVTPAPLQIAELISICAHHAVDCLQATSLSCVLLTSLHLPTHLCVSLPVLRTVHQPVLQQLPLLKMICFCMH